ncbi:MAG: NADPH-dependent FMN reductase [Pseudomonadota bacterium]
MAQGRLLGICGSLRAESFNKKLMREAARLYDPETFVEADLRLPLYDGDLEADGIPLEVQRLSDEIAAADAVVIATPEYNKALSGVLKNALDWVSRTKGSPWDGKPVAIMSAAAGRAGGERSQFSLRLCLVAFNPNVLSQPEVLIAAPQKEFEGERLTGEFAVKLLTTQMERLRALTG